MKTKRIFNAKHEVIITSELKPIGEINKLTVDDIVPYSQKVKNICYLLPISEDGNVKKIYLGRDFILELADQIRQIEGEIIDDNFEIDW